MNQIISMVVALSAIAGVTVYEGIRFGFWNKADPEELSHFARRVESVPKEFGDWTIEEAKVDQEQLYVAGVRAHISRDYINRKTGAKVNVFLVCGKTHHMAIHSPDACYAAAGYSQGDTNRRYIQAEGRNAELWSARFTHEADLSTHKLDILWSWAADDGNWQAPTTPRPHFANKNALYKLYVIAQPGPEPNNKLVGEVFLEDFLIEINRLLFAPLEPETDQSAS